VPIWSLALLGGAVPAVAAGWAWREWLCFCRHIADRHGVEGLKVLPPLATAFRRRQWAVLTPWSGQFRDDDKHDRQDLQ
jgi:hypothetical protein